MTQIQLHGLGPEAFNFTHFFEQDGVEMFVRIRTTRPAHFVADIASGIPPDNFPRVVEASSDATLVNGLYETTLPLLYLGALASGGTQKTVRVFGPGWDVRSVYVTRSEGDDDDVDITGVNYHVTNFEGTRLTDLRLLNLTLNDLEGFSLPEPQKLQRLYVSNNNLVQLILTDFTALTVIYALNNMLASGGFAPPDRVVTSLNIGNNPSLGVWAIPSNLRVKRLELGNTGLFNNIAEMVIFPPYDTGSTTTFQSFTHGYSNNDCDVVETLAGLLQIYLTEAAAIDGSGAKVNILDIRGQVAGPLIGTDVETFANDLVATGLQNVLYDA